MTAESIDWDSVEASYEQEIFTDRLEHMLKLQLRLQRRFTPSGVHPIELHDNDKMDYIRTQTLALENELHEMLRETGWKTWSKKNDINVDAYMDEVADAFHFFMNLMLIVNMSAEELYKRYLRKQQINHDRQDNGYSSPTG